MKHINIIFFILIFGSLVSAQPITMQSLTSVLKKTETDSIRKIERQAAIKFHQLLNNYRSKKGRHLLRWNETLWIASHNHTLWMETNEKLSHIQKKERLTSLAKIPATATIMPPEANHHIAVARKMHYIIIVE